MDKLSMGAAREAAGDHWEDQGARIAPRRNMSPNALAAHTFHVRANGYELALLQLVADLGTQSKQSVARRALREYCERRLRAAGVELPK
jgi:hypothetical protein